MSEGSMRMNGPSSQTVEEILWIIEEARKPITGSGGSGGSSNGAIGSSSMDLDDLDADFDDIDTGDFVCPL